MTGLDPASAVDRVGIAAWLGTGTVADDEAREALLDQGAAHRGGGGGDQTATGAGQSRSAHRAVTAAAATGGAEARPARTAAADPTRGAGNDADPAAASRDNAHYEDAHHIAAQRAAAAEATHWVSAAASRAEVTLTPPTTPAATPSRGRPRVQAPPRSPRPRLTPTPRRRPS